MWLIFMVLAVLMIYAIVIPFIVNCMHNYLLDKKITSNLIIDKKNERPKLR